MIILRTPPISSRPIPIGAGKSSAGAAWVVSRSLLDPEGRGVISANEYGQLETSTLVALAEFCEKHNVALLPRADTPNETAKAIARRRSCQIGAATWLVLSAEKFTARTESSQEAGRGLEVRYAWLDEYAYAKENAFDTILGRLRQRNPAHPNTILITSSINKNQPYNWIYKRFDGIDRGVSLQDNYLAVTAPTTENAINYDEGYLDRMRSSYTPELYKIEVEAEYASITTGRIFSYFDRALHLVNGVLDPVAPIHISVDFNHSPACAIVGQFIDEEIWVVQEFYLLDSNTFELGDAIGSYLPLTNQLVIVHGDASGNQRTANSLQTNWQIIHDALKRHGHSPQRRYGNVNPGVKDSINSTNAAFKHNRIGVDTLCRELIADLETLKYTAKGDIDKRDISRSHLADCLRYLAHDLLPMTRYRVQAEQPNPTVMPWGAF